MVEFACPVPIPAPAEIETELEVPFSTKLVAAGADILTVPFPAPTLIGPIPENASTLLNVPDEVAPVVLPEADSETVEKLVTEGVVAEIVMLCAPTPTLMIPAPEMLTRFV